MPDAATRSACPLPDISTAAPGVQEQLHASFAHLTATGNRAAADYAAYARMLVSAGYLNEGLECLNLAAGLEPSSANWPYVIGQVELRNGNLDSAALAFERAVSLSQADEGALLWLGDTYFELGRFDDAEGVLSRVLARDPESPAALYDAGRTAIARGEFTQALTYLEHARRIDPQATAINYPLALAYRSLKQQDRAAALLVEKGNTRPAMPDAELSAPELNSAVGFEQRGMDALRAQDWKQALQEFRRGIESDPSDVSLRYWLGVALYVSGDQPGAEREWRSVIAQEPGFARARYSLGALLAARGLHTQAREEYAAAVRAAPNMPEAHTRLGDTLVALGQARDALKEYEEAVRIDPTQADAWINGASALIALRDAERARTWLADARRVLPGDRTLADLQARLH
jgi:tetratricopeptide (TPR) repeat protein